MGNSNFKFKQFDVDQAGCAMKINTDGVLLAAIVESTHPPLRILDIGTGTGVIALMLAQRFEKAQIDAVEIDQQAAITAGKNFKNSAFAQRLSVHHADIAQYTTAVTFDLIVSNPPYFVNDLKNMAEKKGIARHTDAQFFEQLLVKVAALLAEEGSFWFVLPIKQARLLIKNGEKHGFFVWKQINLHSDKSKPAFRQIIALGRKFSNPVVEQLNIYEAEKVYTQDYINLLKDFFLAY